MRNLFHTSLIFVTLIFTLMLWGCSSSTSNSPKLDSSGKHPAGWIQQHPNEFRNDPGQCETCHGSFIIAANSGGISGVSCFSANRGTQTCHPNGPSGHLAGWAAPSQHGRAGAMAAPSTTSGFAYCSKCHGEFFDNQATRSCFDCHTNAPHPDAPWRGTTASGTNHVFTNPGNAPQCAKCHRNGGVPATTPAGCFNNTLCHSNGHPAGWADPAQHGARAKAAVTGSSGFGYCKKCHGTDYAGVGTAVSCFLCHPEAPHGTPPWRAAADPTHTNTDQSNAEFCAQCHRNGNNLTSIPPPPLQPATTPPGCFNNTLCH